MIPLEIPDTAQDQRIDLLDRQEFVDQIHNIALTLARNKKSKCYAINGGWGVGKSFVLDMFEEQAQKYGQEGTVLDQYVIFRYNCWEYDYYEEPLIAIVASILEQYEKKILFLQEEEKAILKESLIYIGKELLSIIRTGVKVAYGIDIKPAITGTAEIMEAAQSRIDENHAYDSLFAFKTVLRKLQDTFESLSKHQTIVVIVDELDRCLPEYTIKVLERLHHLFNGISNVQVILSIDRSQLEHVVKQIYGQHTNSRKYLDKFINFELKLPIGSLNDSVDSRFKEYFSCFDCIRRDTHPSDVIEFQKIITESIDMRTRISLVEKCHMMHDILVADTEVMDSAFMCIEMFLTLLMLYNIDIPTAKANFNIETLFNADMTCKKGSQDYTLAGLTIIREKYRNASSLRYYTQENSRSYVRTDDIWGIILGCYRIILGFTNDYWEYGDSYSSSLKSYTRKYWKLLKMIS